ncbi:hypothetical protein CUMW_231010 [Citrus unshiu]|uniref:Uncharacterized protein n=2 Tax=Citrus TaxID=2706 RepID=A0A2H5QHL0_CITUN|nr:hypothetical protein CUMW_231010 [Citrus unshiu]
MDTEDLLHKCQAVVLKEEEADIVAFIGQMRIKGEEVAANCLVGKFNYHFPLDNGPNKATVKSKGRKWKLRARNTKGERANNITFIGSKRHKSEGHGPSPESKKKRVSSPEKQPQEGKHISLAKALGNCNHFSPNKVAR